MIINCFNIQHFSTGDGKGIRTTVFLGGCPLRCPWCHNPECFDWTGKRDLDEIVEEIMHDKEFYDRSGGGVTISGGEPLMQIDDCLALLEAVGKRGIHTIIDTSLAVPDISAERLVGLADMFLVDIKTADDAHFKSICGGSLSDVFGNTEKLASLGADIIFRVPLIPGFNLDDRSLDGIIGYIKKIDYPFSLLGFHRLGLGKYERMGIKYAYADTPALSPETVEAVRRRFTAAGLREAVI